MSRGRTVVPGAVIGELTEALAADAGPLTAIEAAESIRAWYTMLREISALAEVKVMAAAAAIREQIPEREKFDVFVGRHLHGVLEPDLAWLMAETWGVAQKNRAIREFATSKPAAAVEFVSEFVRTGQMEQLDMLDETDERLVQWSGMGPRARRRELRRLYALEPEPAGKTLAEVCAAGTGAADRRAVRSAIEDLRRLESEAARIRDELASRLRVVNDIQARAVVSVVDHVYGTLDSIAAAMQEREAT